MQLAAIQLTIVAWSLFYLVWLVTAFRTKAAAKRDSFASMLVYRIPTIIAFYLLCDAADLPAPLSQRLIPVSPANAVLGMALSVTGLAICFWARATLGTNWSSTVMVKQEHELIRTGPYRFVRHPIYTGMLTMFVANVILSGRWAALLGLAFLVAGFYAKLLREEKLMRAQFPDQYPEYARHVKRLIPFVH